MAYWNDYLLPSLVLGRKELYTLPIATIIATVAIVGFNSGNTIFQYVSQLLQPSKNAASSSSNGIFV